MARSSIESFIAFSLEKLNAGYPDLVESLDFTRSYFCNSTRALNMTVEKDYPYIVTLNIANFQIQAFEFSNTTTYEYGSGELLASLLLLASPAKLLQSPSPLQRSDAVKTLKDRKLSPSLWELHWLGWSSLC